MEITRKNVEAIVDRALQGLSVTNYPLVSISNTRFGTSVYIQNDRIKMRFSDHSVTNFDRVVNEEHFHLSQLNEVDDKIVKFFSDEYKTLVLRNGSDYINFHKQVKVSEIDNWKAARINYRWREEKSVKPNKIDNYKHIIEIKGKSEDGTRIICIVEKRRNAFGAVNIATGEINRTRFNVLGDVDVEVCEVN